MKPLHSVAAALLAASSAQAETVCPASPWTALRDREARVSTQVEEGAQLFLPQGKPVATALVVHGLNLKPSKMDPLATLLAAHGVAAVRMTLAGHGGSPSAMGSVTRGAWLNDLFLAWCAARNEAPDVPIYLVAFSLGALVALDAENSSDTPLVHFNKQVLFAPAVAARARARIVTWLSWFPHLVIPSAAPREYRANSGTAMAAYSALWDSVDVLRSKGLGHSRAPALVFLDPDDELVGESELKDVLHANPHLRWTLLPLTVSPAPDLKPKYHHLIIDARSSGERNWSWISEKLIEHLSLAMPTKD